MPDHSPPPPSGPSTFTRKMSFFAKKRRTSPPISTPVVEDAQLHDRGPSASSNSLGSPTADSSPRRSVSLRSHQSQSSGSISYNKTRKPYIGSSSVSPIKKHQSSRSVTDPAFFQASPRQASSNSAYTRNSPGKGSDQTYYTSLDPPPKAPLSMLVTQFGRDHLPRRDSDKPSLNSYATNSTMMSAAPSTAQGGAYVPSVAYHTIHETATKRMATLDYLRKVHEGHVFYFGTVAYSPINLSTLPSLHPARLGRRATNYVLLGTSLSPLLDLFANNPLEYLRALGTLLTEFDTYSQLSSDHSGGSLSRGRVGQMFKSGMRNVKGRRTSTTVESNLNDAMANNGSTATLMSHSPSVSETMSLPPISSAGHYFQYLQTPNLPFDPDFSTGFATLSDVLIDAYQALLTLLPNPESCVPGVADAFLKVDKSLRKILISGIVNEFGDSARKEAKTEVGGLGKLVLGGLM